MFDTVNSCLASCAPIGQYTGLARNRQHDVTIGAAICDQFQTVHYATNGAVGGEPGTLQNVHACKATCTLHPPAAMHGTV